MLHNRSHKIARQSLLEMGRLFFSGRQFFPGISTRIQPLLAGPTGVGKSYLVESVARELGAEYLRLCRGDWVVLGCKHARPSLFHILDFVTTYPKVVVHLDELDKLNGLQASEWSASIASDIWGLLERSIGAATLEYLRSTEFPGRKKPTPLEIANRLRRRLWIVGSGTWQAVFEAARPGATLGFAGATSSSGVDLDSIARAQLISPELIHRFSSEPIFLEYPSREETVQLLESSGIAALARQLGMTIRADEVNWHHGGMRALETVAARVALAYMRTIPPRQSELPMFAQTNLPNP